MSSIPKSPPIRTIEPDPSRPAEEAPFTCFCGEKAILRHPLNGSPLCAEHASEALDALDELYREYQDHIRDQRSAGYHF